MTVKLISGADRNRYPALMDQMFRGRAEIFAERKKWEVEVTDGWEIDVYDDFNPLYLLSMSACGKVLGSLRLMPSTGRTLMTEVFARAFQEPVDVRSATIWEGTRFCVHPEAEKLTSTGRNLVSCELFLAMCEVCLAAGLTHIIAVYEQSLPRIYKRIGWVPDCLGHSDAFQHGRIFAGLFEASGTVLQNMRQLCGITHDVVADMNACDIAHAAA